MLDFEFSLPTKVIFGRDSENKLPEVIKKEGFKKVLLHSYEKETTDNIPVYGRIRIMLQQAGIEYTEFLGVSPNPTLQFIGEGIELCRRERVDFILAIGGGSVIDSAKGIALGVHTSLEDVWAFVEGSREPDPKNTLKVGVVLTTAAAGSETSTAAVITNEKLNKKRGAHHEANRPYFAIMNPEITCSVPPFQTACGIFDSIMHVCERYFTSTRDAFITDRIAEAIMKSIIEAGCKVMENPNDYEARAAIMWGASLAHNNLISCGRLKGCGIHLIEEELHSVNSQIVHGAGLSVLFPAWARKIYKRFPDRFVQFAVRVWGIEMNYENPLETAIRGICEMEKLIKYLKLPDRLSQIGVSEDSFTKIAEQCTADGRIVSNLCVLTKQDIIEILEDAK